MVKKLFWIANFLMLFALLINGCNETATSATSTTTTDSTPTMTTVATTSTTPTPTTPAAIITTDNTNEIDDKDVVIIGKDDWLFLKSSMDDSLGVYTFTPEQLEELKISIERQTKWFADRGIYYLFVLIPNKETVYPEYLPDNTISPQQVTKYEQILTAFYGNPNVNFLDLREPMLKAKINDQIYFRTDSHWNSLGALMGYIEIINQLSTYFPDLSVPSISDYTVKDAEETYSGDLAGMLLLSDVFNEITPSVTLNDNHRQVSMLKKAVIFKDSFYKGLEPYMSSSFQEIISASKDDQFDYKMLEDDPPDVAMFITIQRGIWSAHKRINTWLPD